MKSSLELIYNLMNTIKEKTGTEGYYHKIEAVRQTILFMQANNLFHENVDVPKLLIELNNYQTSGRF